MSRALIVSCLALALCSSPRPVRAQDDWGLTREPSGARRPPRDRPRRPRGESGRPRAAARTTPTPGRRAEDLIERYLQIALGDPSSRFALDRLIELHTQRDGHTEGLVAAIEARAAQEESQARALLGHLYARLGRADDARATFRQVIAASPREVGARVALAALLHDAGELAEARASLEEALPLAARGAEREEVLRTLGRYALDADDHAGARARFEELARSSGGGVAARSEYPRALAERGDHAGAAGAYAELAGTVAGDRRALGPLLLAWGREALEAGEVETALEVLERARRGASGGARAEVLAWAVEAHRRADRLGALADRLAAERASSFEDLVVLGALWDELGRDELALATYRRALRLRPRDADARLRVTQLLARGGRLAELVAEYRVLVRDHPAEPRFVSELARILADGGEREQALALLDASARRSRDARMHTMLASLYAAWGESERAARALEQVARLEPNDAVHIVALGDQHLSAGRRDEAIAVWRRLLALDEGAEGRELLATVLADHDLLAEAIREFELALAAEPERASAMRLLASTLERAGRLGEAEAMWRRAYEAVPEDDPTRREARERIVAIWMRTDRAASEGARLARAFAGDPPDVGAGHFLAELARRRSAPEEAEAVLRRLLQVDPRDTEVLRALLRVLEQGGRRADALSVLESLVELEPRHASAHLARMADHALALYRDDDAVRYATRAVERTPDDAPAHRRLGDLHRARQEPDAARASYRRALALDSDLHDTALALAELELAAGRSREADALFAQIIRESPDDDLVARAAGASLHLHVGEGDVAALESVLLPVVLAHPERPLYRRLLIEVYDVMLAPALAQVRAGGAGALEAQQMLARYGARGLKPLLEALGSPDPAQRRVALAILSEASVPGAAPALLSLAHSEVDAETRIQAALAASEHASAALAPRFATLTERPEPMLVVAGLTGLARARGRASLPALRSALSSRDTPVRAFAALALGHLRDQPSMSRIVELLGDAAPDVQAAAALALAWAQSEGRAGPLRRLASAPGEARVAALLALGGVSDEASQRALVTLALGGEASVRVAAVAALRSGGPSRPEAMPAPRPRERASAYVMRVGHPPNLAPPDLAPHRALLLEVIRAALRERGSAALEVLTRLQAPPGPIGLGELCADADTFAPGPRAALDAELEALAGELSGDLIAAATDQDARMRLSATRVLSRLASDATRAALVGALGDSDDAVVGAALEGLAARPGPATAAAVAVVLGTHRTWSVRMRAAQVLGSVDDPAALPALQTALDQDAFAFVRAAAAESLATLGDPAARAALERAAASDPEPAVQERARSALTRLGLADRTPTSELTP